MFRILVAEDDASARLLMCEVLRRAGYEPCPARDGVEALEVMEHYQCDLAVVDITMPRMDGIAFTQTLREGSCDLPVLMVTARVTQEDKRRGFRAGTDDYMVKPVDEEEMLWRIEALLRRAGYEPCPARDGVEALEVMEHYQCDLAVVDITMPRMDGITFTQTLREGNCDLPVLMVTARVTQEDKRRGFRAGTDDYMVKPVDEEEMLWRIEALLRRYCSRAERRLTVGSTVLDRSALQVITPQSTWQLTAKEFLLLYKLLSYPRTLFTKRQLIDDIWDLDSDVDEHTVEVYISRLRDKFRDNPDFELRTIRGFGYMGMPREDENAQK